MLSEEKFHDKAQSFALLKNVEGNHFTFEEYKEKIKDLQTDKHDKVIHLYTNAPKEHHSFVQSAKDRSYDVLEMDTMIDTHFMQHLEQKLDGVTFVRVDSDIVDNLVQKDETRESVLSEKEKERVEGFFKAILPESGGPNLELKALSPTDYPVIVTKPEFMRRMQEMQQFQQMGNAPMPEFFNVVINTNHPMIAEKLIKMKGAERKEKFASYLYDLARLNQNMLKGEEMSAFIEKSLEFVK